MGGPPRRELQLEPRKDHGRVLEKPVRQAQEVRLLPGLEFKEDQASLLDVIHRDEPGLRGREKSVSHGDVHGRRMAPAHRFVVGKMPCPGGGDLGRLIELI